MGVSDEDHAYEAARRDRAARGLGRTTRSMWNAALSVAAAITLVYGAGVSPASGNDFSVLLDRDDANNRWLGHMICAGRGPLFSDTQWVSPAPTSGSYVVRSHPNKVTPVPIAQGSIRPSMIANHIMATYSDCATKPGFFYPSTEWGNATLYTGSNPASRPPYVFKGTIVSGSSAQALRVRVDAITFMPPAYSDSRETITPIPLAPGDVVYLTLPDSVSSGTYLRQASGWVIKDHQILNPIVVDGFGEQQYTWPSDLTMLREGDSGEFGLAALAEAPGGYRYGTFAVINISTSDQSAPTITTPLANQTVSTGQPATFSVTASGTAPLAYQWQKNGVTISGATSAAYTTPATTTADSGSTYRVIVSNAAGSVTSTAALLTVNAAGSVPGDLNGDGQRTLTDVLWLIEMLVGLRAKDLATADLTGDGQLTLADVKALIRLLVGLP